ncbi:cytochrome o ubiquinol oxidase subunit IV [Paracoccus sp. R86501]|uniref:cytochrome o ubiquinol oxidase subunit IV n=1 Tax=Paracoccus sp. R86501 TaxID=3101711 RepID=UPI00366F2CC2
MSTHDTHNHADGHADGHDHGSVRSYVTGFVLSVILTAIPFGLVMAGGLSSRMLTVMIVLGMAVAQIVVHMIYFLHMNSKSEKGWTMISLVFTIVVLVIMLSGSVWVMYHMNANMMPMPQGMTGQS